MNTKSNNIARLELMRTVLRRRRPKPIPEFELNTYEQVKADEQSALDEIRQTGKLYSE